MGLVSLNKVSLRYGAHVLLDGAELSLAEGDFLALVGDNGCGKTTLLKIIAGIILPDEGCVERARGVSAAYMPQDVPSNLRGTAAEIVASGLGEMGLAVCEYRRLADQAEKETLDAAGRARFDELVHKINETDSWSFEMKISDALKKLELDPALEAASASAGLKRRMLLGRAIVSRPDIILLDEPTNHLDIDSVIWLEEFLRRNCKTLVFVSHDRTFLQNLATRVVEVDRGNLISFDCDFKTFIVRRDELLRSQERNEAVFDKKLAQQEAWLRQGIKARRTRNEGRVRELMRLREIRKSRRSRKGDVNLSLLDAENSGEKVMDVKNIGISFGNRTVISDFSTTIFSGDKIGIIGRNGVGKTTLLNILLGKLKADCGEVKYGTRLKIVYFDQLRASLNPKTTLFDFVGDGSDYVEVGGAKQSVMGYLQNFLFAPEQIHGEISMLSGGEKNRLLLAKLFTNPANVLVLDEPTNDLDMRTIEILESALVSFKGTILLVSHDRSFLNNIVTGVFCFEGGGQIRELVGGYDEWENYRKTKIAETKPATSLPKPKRATPAKREKFTNRERAELEALPLKIADTEAEAEALSNKLQNLDFIRSHSADIAEINARIAELQKVDEALFARWEILEARRVELDDQK